MLNIKKEISEMKEIISDLRLAEDNISEVKNEILSLENRYQSGELDYKDYHQSKDRILAKKSKEEVFSAYINYTHALKHRFKELNTKIIRNVDSDESHGSLKIGERPSSKRVPVTSLPPVSSLRLEEMDILDSPMFEAKTEEPFQSYEKKPAVQQPVSHEKIATQEKATRIDKEKSVKETREKQQSREEFIELLKQPDMKPLEVSSDKVTDLVPKAPQAKEISEATKIAASDYSKPMTLEPVRKKEMPFAPMPSAPKPKTNDKNVEFGGLFSKNLLKKALQKKERPDQKNMFGKTSIMPSILTYEKSFARKEAISKRDILDPYLLEKQIKELKSLISRKKPEIYKANTIGYVANLTVRSISIYFIEKYPSVFKKIYKDVRHANIKIMANTYINIIFFLTLISIIVSFPVLTVVFGMQGGNFFSVFGKTLLATFGIAVFVFLACSYYPGMEAKNRVRSINTNLPFAIDHMSSVISSGVTPATMFKLISNSNEYGEISVEIEKISSYVEFFGYDVITAMKAVALVTPSEQFKEFIDGFVSTIETGGDLRQFLAQKSAEALLNYRLERQKYVESLSTYSDIYTGLMIAAPLFFVTTLALVAAFNGKIGGMSVTTIIVLGTYIAIPVLNILFLVFLEFNQPEV